MCICRVPGDTEVAYGTSSASLGKYGTAGLKRPHPTVAALAKAWESSGSPTLWRAWLPDIANRLRYIRKGITMYLLPRCVVRSLFAVVLVALPLTVAMAVDTDKESESVSVLVPRGIAPTDVQPAVVAEPVAAPPAMVVGAAVELCCPKPCIQYRHHRRRLKACCTCDPPIETVLLVKRAHSAGD